MRRRPCWYSRAKAVPGVEAFRWLVLPDDQLPAADAVVSVEHVLSYLPNAPAVERAFRTVAAALRLAAYWLSTCSIGPTAQRGPGRRPWRRSETNRRFSSRSTPPDPETYARDIKTFVRSASGA